MEVFGLTFTLWELLRTLLLLFVISVIYDWVQNILWKWKYNVKGYFPLPILGTLPFQLSNPTPDGERSRINRFGKIYGGSLGMTNIINVFDLDILKKILVKDHADFQNRFTLPGVYEPPPSDATLPALKDSEWKRVRSILTPSFSAAKLKMMTTNINQVSEILAQGLLENARSRSTIDPKDIYGCFTMDVIARTAFGIETNSYKNPDDPFIAHGKRVFSSLVFNPVIILMMIFPRLGPYLTRLLKYSMFFPTNSLEFFIDVSKQIIEQRKTDVTTDRVDLLQLMLNSEHDVHKSLSVKEIVSQSFIVFVAGYETTATLLTYASYVLATNPDVQNTLQEEIDKHIPMDCKEITYEKVMELPYLDQFVHETLRMYPPVTAMNRATSEDRDVQIDGYWFPKNTMISCNIYMIHHDDNNYPEPEKFIPERYDWVQNIRWKWKYNVKGYFPLPIIGTLPFALSNPTPDGERRRIERFGKIYGGSLGMVNLINVCDLDILKKILVKDHVEFQNRFTLTGVYEPPPSDATLLALKDAEWKRVRSILTPSFSAAKLKMMTSNINQVSEILIQDLLDNARSRSTIDPKNIFGCFTMDVIARTAFGIETNSYKNPDDPFIAHGKRVFSGPVFNPVIILMMIFPRLGPYLTRLLKYSIFFPTNSLEFFIDVSKQIIEQRKTDVTTDRVDLLQLMLNSEHDVHKRLTVHEIVSQSFIVFVAGYETTATLLTYASYVLATNPDVQNTLQEEIDEHIPGDCKEITYEKVMELPYLDQFVHETLRMYPPVTAKGRPFQYAKET
ncbi:cytochrome P450 3A29-like isoform X3 [Dreissena polymorpha]|uniref:cytochrome P450 3A29-like isoform X3 n=1 Tax=Dreissena polymorpha TaxID=45954 RepID=UPI002265506E|nr:cytochrome P450 3A29-like isoform X3 [Dreissena polymorpha]